MLAIYLRFLSNRFIDKYETARRSHMWKAIAIRDKLNPAPNTFTGWVHVHDFVAV